jgi:hypothetical protein
MIRAKAVTCCAVLAMTVLLTACAQTGIEHDGRAAIRKDAEAVMETFRNVTSKTEANDHELLERKLKARLSTLYSVSWSATGELQAEVYLREHLTRGGGWFSEQRTVQACVRYISSKGSVSMHSLVCPDTAPLSGTVDEDVTVP